MPELPEVEVIRRGLMPHVVARRVRRYRWSGLPLRVSMPEDRLARKVVGEVVTAVDRRAKYLLFRLESGAALIVHLGMSGRLVVSPPGAPVAKHDHFILNLEPELELRFNDARRFGSIQVTADEAEEKGLFAHLGPEPLGPACTAAYLAQRAARRRQPIKNFLMDNRVVVGIGNIYASEILFAARLHPLRPVHSVPAGKWSVLTATCRQVLTAAIACGGTTIADYVNHSGERGYFQVRLQAYGRHGKPCPRCAAKIRKIVLAGRATYFCPRCQRPPK